MNGQVKLNCVNAPSRVLTVNLPHHPDSEVFAEIFGRDYDDSCLFTVVEHDLPLSSDYDFGEVTIAELNLLYNSLCHILEKIPEVDIPFLLEQFSSVEELEDCLGGIHFYEGAKDEYDLGNAVMAVLEYLEGKSSLKAEFYDCEGLGKDLVANDTVFFTNRGIYVFN